MPLNNAITRPKGLDDLQSKSRFLIAQKRSKHQHRRLSMLLRLSSEMGIYVQSLKA
ncbi:hypothetical protein [Crocosphaera sp. Alani8]|uniref:hypothetical protein n=1 Tax=Crocosphaera sp. Alani8 TaxID=3038952 RepID=UPI00313EEA1F